ncbi:DUF1826 domain-containing protein [Gluconacetobacter aggeris]|uniref:DUF1826 domain-containing protein n=1 Tax=Gluconacetobacter aggeris TaxID=1286186 RepID=A0A7W4NXM0_9PROT|nr:DUF1826 domain-containing protein [Gluconacetobacter aggeris]MBB2169887.1 DUF1826 domain-containing protein [Gluconacetobacter aggeris]
MSSCPTRHRLTDLASCGAIRAAGRSILVHPRMPGARVLDAARLHVTEGARLVQARGTIQDIRRRIAGAFTVRTGALLDDALVLATLYATVARQPLLRVRLERIVTDSCRKFHVDHVGLRLLCAYLGPGVQWTADDGATIGQAETGAVVLLKGRRFPNWTEEHGVLHRSPPLSALPVTERMRLLLTVDAADACGGADDGPVTVAA